MKKCSGHAKRIPETERHEMERAKGFEPSATSLGSAHRVPSPYLSHPQVPCASALSIEHLSEAPTLGRISPFANRLEPVQRLNATLIENAKWIGKPTQLRDAIPGFFVEVNARSKSYKIQGDLNAGVKGSKSRVGTIHLAFSMSGRGVETGDTDEEDE